MPGVNKDVLHAAFLVDHRTRRLSPGLGRLCRHIVDRGGRNLGDSRHVIQQCQKAAHSPVLLSILPSLA